MTITALATCVTAIVAFFSLQNDKKKKKASMFSETIRIAMDG